MGVCRREARLVLEGAAYKEQEQRTTDTEHRSRHSGNKRVSSQHACSWLCSGQTQHRSKRFQPPGFHACEKCIACTSCPPALVETAPGTRILLYRVCLGLLFVLCCVGAISSFVLCTPFSKPLSRFGPTRQCLHARTNMCVHAHLYVCICVCVYVCGVCYRCCIR